MSNFTFRECYEMVRSYFLSGENTRAAQRMYADESLPRLRNAGVVDPRVPNPRTFLNVTQRLLDHGHFTVPAHAQGRGRPPMAVELGEKIIQYFAEDPRRSTNDAAARFGVSQYAVWKLLNSYKGAASISKASDGTLEANSGKDTQADDADADLNSDDDISDDESGQHKYNPKPDNRDHEFGIVCSNCRGKVIGFRYTCVQCVDVELCCACEARQAHAQHYVLRVPGPRPQSEVEEVLSRVREAVGMVLFPRRTPEIDEPEIIKPEIEDEGIDDPLRDDPNARPHRLNILERAVIDIPPVKQECIEPGHAETSSAEPAIKEEVVDPGAEFIDTTSHTSSTDLGNTNTVFAHRPGSSSVPPAAKRRRVCPPQPPPSPGTSRHTHNTAATATQDKQQQAVRPHRASSAGFHVMTHALRDSGTGSARPKTNKGNKKKS